MRRCSDAPVSSSFFRVRDSCRRECVTSAPTSSPTYSECFKRDLQRSVANGETCNGDDTQCGLKCGNSYLIDPASGLVPASDPTQTIENCIDTCFDTPGCYSTTYRNGAEGGCQFYNKACWLYHYDCATSDVGDCQSKCIDQNDCDIGTPFERVWYWDPAMCSKDPTSAPTTPTKEPTKAPTTKAPTTKAPTTKAPTTKAPTTKATTKAPTTKAPTTKAPTTKAPTTKAPTTKAPTTKAPTQRRQQQRHRRQRRRQQRRRRQRRLLRAQPVVQRKRLKPYSCGSLLMTVTRSTTQEKIELALFTVLRSLVTMALGRMATHLSAERPCASMAKMMDLSTPHMRGLCCATAHLPGSSMFIPLIQTIQIGLESYLSAVIRELRARLENQGFCSGTVMVAAISF